MRLSHHRSHPLRTTERARREGGYVLALFGLMLVPLLLMAGFAVDIGSWYNQASDIQKAADAASLAGVVWLPDEAKARQVAIAVAKQNGYDDADPNITVTATKSAKAPRRLKVVIKDDRVGSFFYENLGGRKIQLNRDSFAEYALPVPLGSPENTFGGSTFSDPTIPAANQANLWGNIHGARTDNFKGDLYAPACRGSDNCTGQSNTDYDPKGYLYTIDVPAGVTNMDVQVFDAGLYDRGADESVETGDRAYTGTGTTTTTWTFYEKDATELDVTDNLAAASTGFCSTGAGTWSLAQAASAATYKSKWVSICQKSGAVAPGRYLLRVQTSGDGSAANRYALRVNASSTTKPRLSAYSRMSMYNNVAAGNASFYLAEVDQIHRGKVLKLNMYDPGEVSKTATTTGNGTVQVLTPSGAVAATCSASATNGSLIPATLTPCQYDSAVGGASKFNGSMVTLKIPIPLTYSCTAGTVPGCWWKIKYLINGQGNDTTTWSAEVIGDPIHLIEEN